MWHEYIKEGLPNWDKIERHPLIEALKQTPQDAEWHGEGNVFIHTKMVVEELHKLPEFQTLPSIYRDILTAAAILHDIAKPFTTETKVIDGRERVVAPRHAKKGEYVVRELLYKECRVKYPVREYICKLVKYHGLPVSVYRSKDPRREVIASSLEVPRNRLLALLAQADIMGRICNDTEDQLAMIDLFRETCVLHSCYNKPKEFFDPANRFRYLSKQDANLIEGVQAFHRPTCIMTLMVGLPASGKDTHIENNLDMPVVSLDDLRRAYNVSHRDKKGQGQILNMAKDACKNYLRAKKDFVVNATNLTRNARGKWIRIAHEYGASVRIIYLEEKYDTIIQRNKNREHYVPVSAINNMIRVMELPTADEACEIHYRTDIS